MSTSSDSAQSDLLAFLATRSPEAQEEQDQWGGGSRALVSYYLGEEIPPLGYISSVRSIVIRGEDVLVVRNADETHVVPGGRREEGETLHQTLIRELLEETGWEITPVAVLGFWHFHHLTPRPPGYQYPYPDFIHLLYASFAARETPEARIANDYEEESTFRPIREMCGTAAGEIRPNQVLYLRLAASLLDAFKAGRETGL
jgi:ADP-ribose pyrophosphatase YjhB (NUDIX family)